MSNKKSKKTRSPKKRVVIYGGSFNPPHIGHMTAIEAVLRNFPCDEIWAMPSSERLDKKIGVSGKHRVNMLKIALKEHFPPKSRKAGFRRAEPVIKISTLELDRAGPTTTYDTLTELKKLHPRYKFYFLIGSELLWDIRYKWVNGEKLWKSCYFLAIRKPSAKVPPKLPPNIKTIDKDIVWVNISSTLIRSFIKKGYSGIPYIHPRVAYYIKKHNLYR